jgi:hypothetical protein
MTRETTIIFLERRVGWLSLPRRGCTTKPRVALRALCVIVCPRASLPRSGYTRRGSFMPQSLVQIYVHLETKMGRCGRGSFSSTSGMGRFKKIVHDGNSVLRCYINNASLDTNARGFVKPVRSSDAYKIDACVSLLMALSQAILYVDEPSYYETHGIQFLK